MKKVEQIKMVKKKMMIEKMKQTKNSDRLSIIQYLSWVFRTKLLDFFENDFVSIGENE